MEPRAHAHEMLLGFALAVVAGNQLGVASPRRMAAMLVAWAAARVAFLAAPASLLAAALNAAFAALLALHVAPRLFGSAKKLRNQALPLVLTALCAAAAAWHFTGGKLVYPTVALFALLMLFMGGRIVAPAVAGQLYRQGERLDARVQPRLEAVLIVAGFAAAGTLAAGYAWLALGLAAFGAALWAGRHQSAALHLITVGALGTLTLNVMAQAWLLKARRDPSRVPGIVAATVLMALATVFRMVSFLELAAGCWTAAFVMLLAIFWRSGKK
jgi:uncharacterized protein involved in response to NO